MAHLTRPRALGNTAMLANDQQMVLLHAYLNGQAGAASRALSQLTGPGAADGLAGLTYAAAACLLPYLKFGPAWSRGDVITFVARVRALLSDEPAALDPHAAERGSRSALGDTPDTPLPSPAARARAQVLLLGALTQSLALDEPSTSRSPPASPPAGQPHPPRRPVNLVAGVRYLEVRRAERQPPRHPSWIASLLHHVPSGRRAVGSDGAPP